MRIGILGGGQLGAMLALAASRLGLELRVVEPKPGCPAARVAPTLAVPYDDAQALRELSTCDVVTYEFESVPAPAVAALGRAVPVHPAPGALAATGDRLSEKRLLRRLGFGTAAFEPVDSSEALRSAAAKIGLPARLKTRHEGYDGKGQWRLRRAEDLEEAARASSGRAALLEEEVDFDREVSLLAVRARDGEIRFWDPVENLHVDGVLRVSRAPAGGLGAAGLARARSRVVRWLEHFDYVGVLAMEFFVRGDLWLANETACRVHNSGHWTLEGSCTSQFENHVRAVAGLPLGDTGLVRPSAMLNLLGELPPAESVLAVPGAHLHVYGKQPAPGRKLGHVTLTADSAEAVERRLADLAARLGDDAGALAAP